METEKDRFRRMLDLSIHNNPDFVEIALKVIIDNFQAYREKCRRDNDNDLRAFADMAFPVLVDKMKPKKSFWRRVMQVDWLKEMFVKLGYNSPNHCQAVQDAWKEYEDITKQVS